MGEEVTQVRCNNIQSGLHPQLSSQCSFVSKLCSGKKWVKKTEECLDFSGINSKLHFCFECLLNFTCCILHVLPFEFLTADSEKLM